MRLIGVITLVFFSFDSHLKNSLQEDAEYKYLSLVIQVTTKSYPTPLPGSLFFSAPGKGREILDTGTRISHFRHCMRAFPRSKHDEKINHKLRISFFLHPKTQPNKRIEKDPFPSKQTKTVVPDQTMKKTYLKWLWIFSLSFFFVWKHCQCYVHISMNSFVIRGEEHFGFHFGFLKICKFMNDAIIFFFPKIMSWFAYSNPKKGALVMERRGLWKRKCRSRTWNYIP